MNILAGKSKGRECFDNGLKKQKYTLVLFTCYELDQFQGIITERIECNHHSVINFYSHALFILLSLPLSASVSASCCTCSHQMIMDVLDDSPLPFMIKFGWR